MIGRRLRGHPFVKLLACHVKCSAKITLKYIGRPVKSSATATKNL